MYLFGFIDDVVNLLLCSVGLEVSFEISLDISLLKSKKREVGVILSGFFKEYL